MIWCYMLVEENKKTKELLIDAEKTMMLQTDAIQHQKTYINMLHRIMNY